MGRDNYYFYISGIISLTLFGLILSILGYSILTSSKNKIFALKKDTFISVSIDIPKVKPEPIAPKPQQTTPVIEESKQIDVGELFSDIWTKKIETSKKPIEKKVINKRLQEALTKSKTLEKKEFKPILKENRVASSTGDEVNEYLAKIQALVYKNFYPPKNSQGYSLKAVVELDAMGVVKDFRILTYSENVALNNECDKIKQRLINQLFPVNPENKRGSFIIILTSKE